jgi:hypothetical protein
MYGSHDYLKHLLQRIGTFEIVVLRAEIRLHASLDTLYFRISSSAQITWI